MTRPPEPQAPPAPLLGAPGSLRRWWLVGAVVLLLVATAAGVWLVAGTGGRPCGESVTSRGAAGSTSPFDVDDAPPPLTGALGEVGEVLGSRGYDYDQEVQLSAFATGLGVRLRDENRFTMLGPGSEGLTALWSVSVGTRASTFDADEETYAVLTLPDDDAPELVALDLATGERSWCSRLETDPGADAVVSTQLLGDGSVAVLLERGGSRDLLRAGADGGWRVEPGAGDFLGLLGEDRLLVGGSDLPSALDPDRLAGLAAGPRLVAVDVADGQPVWSHQEPEGVDLSVVGTTPDRVVVVRTTSGGAEPELVALDHEGREAWSRTPTRGTAFDATVRGGRVVVRAGTSWSAYAADDGAPLWDFAVPENPQLLPYGAVLDAMPSLDPDTLLVPGTQALVELDLTTGERAEVPLPVDGLSTTYWPYRVVAPPGLLAVATNTGAVVVRR